MRTRDHYYLREKSVSDTDTIVVNLDTNEPISFLKIEVEATNGSTSSIGHEPHDDISRIELVDGSRVVASLSMADWIALNAYELGKIPAYNLSEAADAVQEESCFLHFGRNQGDPNLYIRPGDFNNLQLRITIALTVSATVGFATGTGKVSVMARVIEEGAGVYQGYLAGKEKYSWTSATSGEEVIDLPTDHPYRYIGVKALKTLLTPREVISQVKVSLDSDSRVPFNIYTEDLADENERLFGQFRQSKIVLAGDDDVRLLDLYNIQDGVVRANVDEHLATLEAIDAESVQAGLYDLSTAATPALQTTDKDLAVTVWGLAPAGIYLLPFGDPNDFDTWLDVRDWSDVKVVCTQAAAGACKILLQQHIV